MSRAIHVFRTPDRFVAGTVGEPGDRSFFLQAVHDSRVVSVALEKQQVQVLADRMGLLLDEVHRRFGAEVPPEESEVGGGTCCGSTQRTRIRHRRDPTYSITQLSLDATELAAVGH